MGTTRTCDVCGKPTDEIVAKLFLAPIRKGSNTRHHSQYTHHLDVGSCCGSPVEGESRIMRAFKWRPRLTVAEYRGRGKKAS